MHASCKSGICREHAVPKYYLLLYRSIILIRASGSQSTGSVEQRGDSRHMRWRLNSFGMTARHKRLAWDYVD